MGIQTMCGLSRAFAAALLVASPALGHAATIVSSGFTGTASGGVSVAGVFGCDIDTPEGEPVDDQGSNKETGFISSVFSGGALGFATARRRRGWCAMRSDRRSSRAWWMGNKITRLSP